MLQLTEAESSLAAKSEAAAELEAQITALQGSLEQAQADIDTKQSTVEDLEKAKADAEAELATLKDEVQKLRADNDSTTSLVETVRTEVMTFTRLPWFVTDKPA